MNLPNLTICQFLSLALVAEKSRSVNAVTDIISENLGEGGTLDRTTVKQGLTALQFKGLVVRSEPTRLDRGQVFFEATLKGSELVRFVRAMIAVQGE